MLASNIICWFTHPPGEPTETPVGLSAGRLLAGCDVTAPVNEDGDVVGELAGEGVGDPVDAVVGSVGISLGIDSASLAFIASTLLQYSLIWNGLDSLSGSPTAHTVYRSHCFTCAEVSYPRPHKQNLLN